jgi:hypothetical protein
MFLVDTKDSSLASHSVTRRRMNSRSCNKDRDSPGTEWKSTRQQNKDVVQETDPNGRTDGQTRSGVRRSVVHRFNLSAHCRRLHGHRARVRRRGRQRERPASGEFPLNTYQVTLLQAGRADWTDKMLLEMSWNIDVTGGNITVPGTMQRLQHLYIEFKSRYSLFILINNALCTCASYTITVTHRQSIDRRNYFGVVREIYYTMHNFPTASFFLPTVLNTEMT